MCKLTGVINTTKNKISKEENDLFKRQKYIMNPFSCFAICKNPTATSLTKTK